MQPLAGAVLGVAAGFSSSRLASCQPQPTARSPPGWVFSVVWTLLYALQGAAATRSPVLLSVLVLELAWPFVYCANQLASRLALFTASLNSLFRLRRDSLSRAT